MVKIPKKHTSGWNTTGTKYQHGDFLKCPKFKELREAERRTIPDPRLILTKADLKGCEAPPEEEDWVVQPIYITQH